MWFAKADAGLGEQHRAKVRLAAKVLSGRKNLREQIGESVRNSVIGMSPK
jgi:hypothetical protein